jgi:hypothetical protein
MQKRRTNASEIVLNKMPARPCCAAPSRIDGAGRGFPKITISGQL